MDNSVIINGFIHQLFTKNEIVTDAECLDILHTYFKLPLYTIAAFAPDTKNNNGSYQYDVITMKILILKIVSPAYTIIFQKDTTAVLCGE